MASLCILYRIAEFKEFINLYRFRQWWGRFDIFGLNGRECGISEMGVLVRIVMEEMRNLGLCEVFFYGEEHYLVPPPL